MNNKIKIVERLNGYWLIDVDDSIVDGPFEVIEEAQHELEQIQVWKEVDYNLGLGKERHEN
jgi:hypothetical protein